jgi:hypothetical protein
MIKHLHAHFYKFYYNINIHSSVKQYAIEQNLKLKHTIFTTTQCKRVIAVLAHNTHVLAVLSR